MAAIQAQVQLHPLHRLYVRPDADPALSVLNML